MRSFDEEALPHLDTLYRVALRLTGDPAQAEMTLAQALRSPQFIILVATNFFCCATHSGPIFHTVSYAEICGISALGIPSEP